MPFVPGVQPNEEKENDAAAPDAEAVRFTEMCNEYIVDDDSDSDFIPEEYEEEYDEEAEDFVDQEPDVKQEDAGPARPARPAIVTSTNGAYSLPISSSFAG